MAKDRNKSGRLLSKITEISLADLKAADDIAAILIKSTPTLFPVFDKNTQLRSRF
jgi:hypothetical protein